MKNSFSFLKMLRLDKMIAIACLDAPYRNIDSIFPDQREGKSILWVLGCTSKL
jgi:hypothetical protein